MKPSAPVMKTRRGASATGERALVVGSSARIHSGVELVQAERAPDRVPAPRREGRLEAQDPGDPARDEDLRARALDRGGHRLADLIGLDPAPPARRLGPNRQLGPYQVRVNGGELDPVAVQ